MRHFWRERRKTWDLDFNSPLVRFCCCIVLLSLPCIFQQNEPSYPQPVETWERRSLTDSRWKEQDFLLQFWVGWREDLPKFPLTSPLAQPFLTLQAKTIWTIAIGGACLLLMNALSQGYHASALRSLAWVLAKVSGQINQSNFQKETVERCASAAPGH